MNRLRAEDIKVVLEFLPEIYQARDYESFGQFIVKDIHKITNSEAAFFHPGSLLSAQRNAMKYVRTQMFFDVPFVVTPAMWEHFFKRGPAEHPLFGYMSRTRDKSAAAISDFIKLRKYQETPYIREAPPEWLQRGYVDEIAISLGGKNQSSLLGGFEISVRPNHSARVKQVLNVLRPHLRQAFLNSVAVSQLKRELSSITHAVELMDRGVVVLKEAGRIGLMTPQAHEWLKEYFGPSRLGQLPEELRRWVRSRQEAATNESAIVHVREPLRVEREGRILVVRLVADGSNEFLLLEEKRGGATVEELQERFELTRREAEVLYWVAEGKSNAAVATILTIKPKTVEKHLERIFLKLGVENRTEAATMVCALDS